MLGLRCVVQKSVNDVIKTGPKAENPATAGNLVNSTRTLQITVKRYSKLIKIHLSCVRMRASSAQKLYM